MRQILEGNLENAIQTRDLKLSLMNADEAVLAIWTISEAWPVKWGLSEFKDGENNELAVETLELTYTHINKNA
ncbi:phage tail protein [Mucilaginibacter sp. ZB1P21]|uniref:Phage tail protein n=1 Tax=Mucilaginibacter glaciei TaxID=2772109 RepID=A0A926P0A7_9SPHI|nr:phage tail protein [Mucilaginibacter glaciei]